MQISYRTTLLVFSMVCVITSQVYAGEQPSRLSRALNYYDNISPIVKTAFAIIVLPSGIIAPTLITAHDKPVDSWNYYIQPHVLVATGITLATVATTGFMAVRECSKTNNRNQNNETPSQDSITGLLEDAV